MNSYQRRKAGRLVLGDHFRWPLGTTVLVRRGHHSPAAVGLIGRVIKHGYPCRSRDNCIVEFATPVMDMTFGAERFGHYVAFCHLSKARMV